MKHLLPLLADETVAAETQTGTADMSSMASMLDTLLIVMLIACGIYCIYTYFKINKTCMLSPNRVLYPGNCKPEDCIDVDGFMDFMLPRVLILGILLVLSGTFLGIMLKVVKYDSIWLNVAYMVVPILFFIWYVVAQRKAAKEFWAI